MLTIYKYPVLPSNFTIDLPVQSKILTVQMQGDSPQMWVLLDRSFPLVSYRFVVYGTGHEIKESQGTLSHVGTFQLAGGSLIFHLFQVIEPLNVFKDAIGIEVKND